MSLTERPPAAPAASPHDAIEPELGNLPARIATSRPFAPPTAPPPLKQAPPTRPLESASDPSLPVAAHGADLPRPALHVRWKALVLGLTLIIYLAFVNQVVLYSSPPTGDQPFYLMVTISIAQDGDFNIANNFANRDEDKFYRLAPHPEGFVGMGAPYPLPPHNAFTPARPSTEQYNFHWPGLSLLLVPAWVIGGLFSLWWPATVVFMCIIGALAVFNAFLFAYELTGKLWIALAVWAAIAFTNPVMSYAYLIFTELTVGLLLIYALRRLALGWDANGPYRRALIGLAIGFMPWVAWRCAPIAGCLALYAAIQWWRSVRNTRSRGVSRAEAAGTSRPALRSYVPRALLSTLPVVTPVIVSALLMVWHNLYLYGSISGNGFTPEKGLEDLLYWPWEGRESLTRFSTSIYGLLFDQHYGLFIYAPFYILSVVGLILMAQSSRRSDRRLLGAIALICLPYLLIIFAWYFWNGLWCPPARFLTTFAPLLAGPLAVSLAAASNWAYRVLFGLLVLPGYALMWPMLADPRHFWPANSVIDWWAGRDGVQRPPIFGLSIDLTNILPAVDPLDERRLPTNSAWVTAAALAIIVLGYLLSRRWRSRGKSFGYRPLPFAAQGVAWIAGLALVSGTWYFTNYEYVQPKTTLTQVVRWPANHSIPTPRGIEYLNGMVYVTDYDSNAVSIFDVQTGASAQLQVFDATGQNILFHPGDIKRGPDGNLYVLNNRLDGLHGIVVMDPQGRLVRSIHLNSKTPIAIGLWLSGEGKIYVSDMTGARVRRYAAEGGDPEANFQGERNGIDNATSVVVANDGTIYVGEISYRRVQEIAPDGTYLRSFTTGCSPWGLALNGDWLEISCPEGSWKLFSVNRSTGSLQRADVENAEVPFAPTGMIYAPDGTLYVIDGSTLYGYRVRH